MFLINNFLISTTFFSATVLIPEATWSPSSFYWILPTSKPSLLCFSAYLHTPKGAGQRPEIGNPNQHIPRNRRDDSLSLLESSAGLNRTFFFSLEIFLTWIFSLLIEKNMIPIAHAVFSHSNLFDAQKFLCWLSLLNSPGFFPNKFVSDASSKKLHIILVVHPVFSYSKFFLTINFPN